MQAAPEKTPAPLPLPGIVPALVRGFNIAAANVHLVLLPVMLDVLLWLGPRLGVEQVLTPALSYVSTNLLKAAQPAQVEAVNTALELLQTSISQFNLVSLLSTFPVGVPALTPMAETAATPYGAPLVTQVGGTLPLLGLTVLLIVIGWLLGSLYFGAIGRAATEAVEPFNLRTAARHFVQVAALTLLLLGLALLVTVPGALLVSLITVVSPVVGQFLMFFVIFLLVWLIVPLLFAPLGIFTHQMNAITALLNSWRLTRFYLPTGGMFIMTAAVLGLGLDMLWTLPEASSWLLGVGILGHAFIYTALVAAAFVYFRGGMKVMQSRQTPRPPVERPTL